MGSGLRVLSGADYGFAILNLAFAGGRLCHARYVELRCPSILVPSLVSRVWGFGVGLH